MVRATIAILALALLAPALAGCLGVGGDDDGSGSDGLDTKSRAEVTSDEGGIEGVVTDPAVQAVEEASVSLEELGVSTTTQDDGSFAFSNVQPGAYTLNITKDGFIPTERSIEVDAGTVATVEVVLTHQPTTTPYMQQFEFKGFMECSAGVAGGAFILSSNVCSEGPLGDATNTETVFTHEIQPNPWQIVTEVDWEPATPISDRFWLSAETIGFSNAWKVAYTNVQETAPIVSVTDRQDLTNIARNFTAICEGEEDPETTSNQASDAYCNHDPIDAGAEIYVEVSAQSGGQTTVNTPDPLFPVGVGASVQQDFTIFQTVFYNAPACEGYSIIEDNRCDQMDAPPEEDPYDEISGGDGGSD